MTDTFVRAIGGLYSLFDTLSISMEVLMALAVVFILALVFATREVISWFLKTDDIKRDLARLEELILQMEGQLRALERALPARKGSATHISEPLTSGKVSAVSETKSEIKTATLNSSSEEFPITH